MRIVKVILTIIIIPRITHAFDCAFNCAFDKSNILGHTQMQMQMFKVCIQMQMLMHLQIYGGI